MACYTYLRCLHSARRSYENIFIVLIHNRVGLPCVNKTGLILWITFVDATVSLAKHLISFFSQLIIKWNIFFTSSSVHGSSGFSFTSFKLRILALTKNSTLVVGRSNSSTIQWFAIDIIWAWVSVRTASLLSSPILSFSLHCFYFISSSEVFKYLRCMAFDHPWTLLCHKSCPHC